MNLDFFSVNYMLKSNRLPLEEFEMKRSSLVLA
jgi:hypothetical protein